MTIYTKTGDRGETDLFTGERVKKHDARINALGEADELYAHLGLIRSELGSLQNKAFVKMMQEDIFVIMSMLASGNDTKYAIPDEKITTVEAEIDRLQELFQSGKGFVVPGESRLSAIIDIGRTVARRVERAFTKLAEDTDIDKNALRFLNRLSDYLFTLARYTENGEAL